MNKIDGFYAVMAILICVVIAMPPIYLLAGTDAKYTVTVKEKWIKGTGGECQKYLFSDMNGEVFSIEDSWWKTTFDASDRYAKIQPGHTYEIETFGRRSHFWSNYPNAVGIREV